MKSIIVAAALSGFLLMGDGSATAGIKTDSPVLVSFNPDGSGGASGALGTARNSANQVEFIGCVLHGSRGNVFASCSVRDAAGTFMGCVARDPAFLEVLKSVTSDAVISFFWDAQGNCTEIAIETASNDAPKLP